MFYYYFMDNWWIGLIALIVIYGLIAVYCIRYNNKQKNLHSNISDETKNLFVEYRRWVPLWGFFVDGQKENQKTLSNYNEKGWRAIQYVNSTWNFTISKLVIFFIISTLTLGFVQLYTGVGFLFEKDVK